MNRMLTKMQMILTGKLSTATVKLLDILDNSSATNENVISLIKAGADVNAQTNYGETALTQAEKHNSSPEVKQLLLDAAIDVNVSGNYNMTALTRTEGYSNNPEETQLPIDVVDYPFS